MANQVFLIILNDDTTIEGLTSSIYYNPAGLVMQIFDQGQTTLDLGLYLCNLVSILEIVDFDWTTIDLGKNLRISINYK